MTITHNFLPQQYEATNRFQINHNYLPQQFADHEEIFSEIQSLIRTSDYTLGRPVDQFERTICNLTGATYAVAVGSGTDALFLSLKALGIGPGDEVITTPYTFFATIGAIVTAGAKPVFVDICEGDYNIDPSKIEPALTPRTKAILPVHWSGCCCDMLAIGDIARTHNLRIVEDACHAINASHDGKSPGTFGDAGCFSMHPLKNINVWGDGGFITTDSGELHDTLVLMRNHGLMNRDECLVWGYNSRLDSLQAIVANHLLKRVDLITDSRIANARYFDQELKDIPQLIIPQRKKQTKHVFHIYVIRAELRGELLAFLAAHGIDAKVHYPIPMHLQPAAKSLNHAPGDFPVAEKICASVISLPVHEFITAEQREFIAATIREFYGV